MSAAVPESHRTCPDCAEEVKAAARVCRFCGHRFEAVPSSTAFVPARRDSTASRGSLLAALTVLGVAAALIVVVILATAPRANTRDRVSSRFEPRGTERAGWGVPAVVAIGIAGAGIASILLMRRQSPSHG